jgi:hypothetical protein
MKKFLFILLLVIIGTFAGCDEQPRKLDGSYEDLVVGDYHCSKFGTTSEYLKFLDDFDYENKEILYVTKSGEYSSTWEVTWKEK